MNILKTIFLKIAARLGLELQRKPLYGDDYSRTDDISLTAVIANRVSTLAMQDSGASIEGNNARATYMQEFLQNFIATRMPVGAEVSLGTGDCLV